jgi:hypothetical protein
MIRVCVLRDYKWPDLLRQTPGHSGRWDDIQFLVDGTDECDLLVVLNGLLSDVEIACPKDRVWLLLQEPPDEAHKCAHLGRPEFARIYTTDDELRSPRHVLDQPALPWHVDKDYDYLKSCAPPKKTHTLSWVTSNKAITAGHRKRLRFLDDLQRNEVGLDLFGRGFKGIEDKWDALAPYRYSLAIENFANQYYWSEKIADCFLAWTMPIYFGCSRIGDYFPPESMVVIDIDDPEAIDQIRDALASDRWSRNRDAIECARNLVLDRYQLFPFLAAEIRSVSDSDMRERPGVLRRVRLRARPRASGWRGVLSALLPRFLRRLIRSLLRLIRLKG